MALSSSTHRCTPRPQSNRMSHVLHVFILRVRFPAQVVGRSFSERVYRVVVATLFRQRTRHANAQQASNERQKCTDKSQIQSCSKLISHEVVLIAKGKEVVVDYACVP